MNEPNKPNGPNKLNGQVMICLCGGLRHHAEALIGLADRNIRAVVAIPTGYIGKIGFMSEDDIEDVSRAGHFVCNYSQDHLWLGRGRLRARLLPHSQDDITKDYLNAKNIWKSRHYHGDYLVVPFGTANVAGPEHLKILLEHFKWIRLTVGTPMPGEKLWVDTGGHRLYPRDYPGRVVGITIEADARWPDAVRESVNNAQRLDRLCIIDYHPAYDLVGDGRNITYGQFIKDMEFISGRMTDGLEVVTPLDLIKENR